MSPCRFTNVTVEAKHFDSVAYGAAEAVFVSVKTGTASSSVSLRLGNLESK